MVKLFGKLKKIRKGVQQDAGHLASKGFAAVKAYAEKAPERREARLAKLQQQTKIAEAEARLARAQGTTRKARAVGRPAVGFGMGLGSAPGMGLGGSVMTVGPALKAPAAKKRRSKKKSGKRTVTVTF